MPNISRVWFAMRTRNANYAGTDSPIVLTVNVNGIDVVNQTFVDSVQSDQEEGQANLYWRNTMLFDAAALTNSSVRVGIRGDDAWRPEHIFLFGEPVRTRGSSVVPLAIETDLNSQLSTDRMEGPLTIPVKLVGLGNATMRINRLLLLMTTADRRDAGTDSPLDLQVSAGGGIVVNHQIPDTPQNDQERGEANLYFIPVPNPFTKSSVSTITLAIQGTDAWLPESLFLFGLDIANGRPTQMAPLVSMTSWQLGWLSSDSEEGSQSVTLPQAGAPVLAAAAMRKTA